MDKDTYISMYIYVYYTYVYMNTHIYVEAVFKT